MKKILIYSVFILLSNLLNGQDVKQYSGDYPNGTTISGKANYSYYLKDDNKLKHGLFTYTYNTKTDEGYINVKITGNYKDNVKDGQWSYAIDYKDYDNGAGNTYTTGTIKSNANYVKGIPQGQWTYTEVNKARHKNFTVTGYEWSAYNPETTTTATANYNNGILVGAFNMKNVIDNVYKNISGVLDNNGFLLVFGIFLPIQGS